MRFWMREVMGWLLVLVGLVLIYLCVALLLGGRFAEAAFTSMLGIFVFRGGIHLLKVAVAARIAMQTQSEIAKPPTPAKQSSKTEVPWDW